LRLDINPVEVSGSKARGEYFICSENVRHFVVMRSAEPPSGNVNSWVERNEARQAAWVAPGVREVEDHIAVIP